MWKQKEFFFRNGQKNKECDIGHTHRNSTEVYRWSQVGKVAVKTKKKARGIFFMCLLLNMPFKTFFLLMAHIGLASCAPNNATQPTQTHERHISKYSNLVMESLISPDSHKYMREANDKASDWMGSTARWNCLVDWGSERVWDDRGRVVWWEWVSWSES